MWFSYSLSQQPPSTGPLSVQLSAGARDNRLSAPSRFHPSLCPSSPLSLFLRACICFITLPTFPHAITVIFPVPLPLLLLVHFFTSPLSLVPPLLLAHLSFFLSASFPLQWFFRFFPTCSPPLSSPDYFHPTLCPPTSFQPLASIVTLNMRTYLFIFVFQIFCVFFIHKIILNVCACFFSREGNNSSCIMLIIP